MNDSMTLRRAGPADAAAVLALTRAAYAKWVPLIGREPKPMTADYAVAIRDHIVDLYEREGALLALIEMIPTPEHLLVENVAVHPDAQATGLGDQLMRHAEQVARSLGLHELQLYTNVAFTANIDFYARRGFTEFRRETFPGGAVAVHMRKHLGSAPGT